MDSERYQRLIREAKLRGKKVYRDDFLKRLKEHLGENPLPENLDNIGWVLGNTPELLKTKWFFREIEKLNQEIEKEEKETSDFPEDDMEDLGPYEKSKIQVAEDLGTVGLEMEDFIEMDKDFKSILEVEANLEDWREGITELKDADPETWERAKEKFGDGDEEGAIEEVQKIKEKIEEERQQDVEDFKKVSEAMGDYFDEGDWDEDNWDNDNDYYFWRKGGPS